MKTVLVFSESSEIVSYLKNNLKIGDNKYILVLSSAYVRSKQIVNELGAAFVPYVEIVRQVSSTMLHIAYNTVEARPIGTGEKLRGLNPDVIIIHDPASIPADVLKEVLS